MTLDAILFLGLIVAALVGFTAFALFVTVSDALYDRRLRQARASARSTAEEHPAARHA